jgi:N-methylhydantoinase A/oxoprolinase/acetone carboxylase beta subunit
MTVPTNSYSLGIDIGGTFTDIVVYDHARGVQHNRKVLTTHDDPARAVAAGVEGLCESTACRRASSRGSCTPPRCSRMR